MRDGAVFVSGSLIINYSQSDSYLDAQETHRNTKTPASVGLKSACPGEMRHHMGVAF